MESPEPLPANALGGVSSFGLGGSNAHAVLESAPPVEPPAAGAAGVLTVSAPSEQALRRNVDSIATALHTLDDQRLASWCRATNVVKRSHRHRLVLEGNRGTLVDGLRDFLAGARADLASSAPMRKVPAGVGLLCSGQGTQYPGMTRPLYDANPMYREHLDAAAAALDPHLPSDLFAAIFGDDPGLDHTSLAQPALFAVSYALGKTLLQSGIRPAFGIGHSVGELAAACLAGVLSVDDAARLIAVRGRLMGSLPPGGAMIAVDLGVEQAEALIADEPGCAIAAVNGPRSVAISGAADAVARAHAAIRGQGGRAVNLTVSHAFHSPLMEPIVAEFRRELSGLAPGPAEFPLFSTVLGREVEGHEMDTDYWANQICSPVRFFDAVQAARSAASADYVAEAGPRSTLLTLARQCGLPPQTRSLTLCGGPDSDGTELLGVAATVLRDGYSPDLSPLYGRPAGRLHRIPPYVFDTSSRFWFDGGVAAVAPTAQPAVVTPVAEREQPSRAPAGTEGAVLAVIADVGGYSVAELARSSLLADDLGYDSLLQLRLIDRLRTEYPQLEHITVAEVLPNIHSVGDLVDFVVQRLDPAGVTRADPMSILTREIIASAASSPHYLTVGTVADPVRLTWREVHEQAKRMAGGLAARGVGRHGSVAVLAADAGDVAPLAQAIWLRRAALTMLQQPTPRTDLAVWLDDTVRAILMIRADVVVVGEPFLMALDHLAAHNLAVCTVESLRGAEPIEPDDADEADIAMRQLTSGSTGIPKAVEISHGNFAANTVAMCAGLDVDIDRDVVAELAAAVPRHGHDRLSLRPHAIGCRSRRGHA